MHVPCNMLNVSLLVVAVSREIGYKWASFYIWTILFRSEILSACLCAKSITSTPLCVSILLVETLSKECSNSNSNSISQQKKVGKNRMAMIVLENFAYVSNECTNRSLSYQNMFAGHKKEVSKTWLNECIIAAL